MNTNIEHFQTSPLPTPELRTLLLDRLNDSTKLATTFSHAIIRGFDWGKTEEGYAFWEQIYDMTREHERSLRK